MRTVNRPLPKKVKAEVFLSLCIELIGLQNSALLFGAKAQEALQKVIEKRLTKVLQASFHSQTPIDTDNKCSDRNVQHRLAWSEGHVQLSVSAPKAQLHEAIVQELIQTIVSQLQKPIKVPGQALRLECQPRIGYHLGQDLSFEKASFALRIAPPQKQSQHYSERSRKALVSRLQRENEMRQGLRRGEFVSYFQPKIDPRNNEVVGAEALVRWQHPTEGLLMPKDFLDVAEQSSLICDISQAVAKQTVALLIRLQKQAKVVPIAINLSEQDLRVPELIEQTGSLLKKHGLSPRLINLEVSERVASMNEDDVADFIRAVQQEGFSLALDDFGTAYSGLLRLLQLPISEIKVDRLFLVKAAASSQGRDILHSLVTMLLDQNYRVTVEGVEKRWELELLQAMPGCFAQGFYFSPAVNAKTFQSLSQAC
jgi:EAL domain-containing protein (putative c-di-GMP-specific phosphodiesterase class I)